MGVESGIRAEGGGATTKGVGCRALSDIPHTEWRERESGLCRDHTRARQSTAHMSHDTSSIKFVTRKRTRHSLVARPSELHCIEPRRASAAICAKSREREVMKTPMGDGDAPCPKAKPNREIAERRSGIRVRERRSAISTSNSIYRKGMGAVRRSRRSLCKLRNMLHGALPRPTPLSLCPTRYTRRAARHPDRRWPPRDPPLRNASTLER